ncbi:hypothetical protein ACFY36_06330 [Actinoplanes sp. NPDC000266]
MVRAAGVEPESEIAYSALLRRCVPLLDRLSSLPAPQRTALSNAAPAATQGNQALADALVLGSESRFREAIELLTAAETTANGCRARLLYGEWLRRRNRHTEARAELQAAHDAFEAMGAAVYAERAARELREMGQPVRERPTGVREDLTR